MPEYMINGIPVNFPYEPYSVQETYMEKVIECLKQGVNGMLESPTGTGKTLCLLCASLSWLTLKKAQIQSSRNEHLQKTCDELLRGLQNEPGMQNSTWASSAPKIIYASRTHSQLTQVIQELKKCGYGHIKVTVLGSRDQLCIHPQVSQSQENVVKINKCQSLIKSKNCYFHLNFDRNISRDANYMSDKIMDIEDLVKVGQKQKICPYYLAREMRKNADIIFIPYNYILDRKLIRTHDLQLANSVVILDEAHNIEKICEESVSLKISTTDVALCINEVSQVMEHVLKSESSEFDIDDEPIDFPPDQLCLLKTIFLELEKAIDDIELKCDDLSLPGSFIVELLGKVQINKDNNEMLITMLEKVIQFLSVSGKSPFQFKGAYLQKVVDLLYIVFDSKIDFFVHLERLKKNFKVHISREEIKKSKDSWNNTKSTVSKGDGKVLSFMCFTPSYGMKDLLKQGVRCVIFTSGTLSPLPALMSELGISIPVTLENPHVIGPDQVNVSIIKKGADGHELNSSFKTRNDPKYLSSLGNTILNICRIIPHGLLIFFPSYPTMYKCKDDWQESGLWSKICTIKPIFVEPKSKDTFPQVMKEYYDAIQGPNCGACFMAVTRGKVSEGLDFMDVNGRAVVVTGLPYPPMLDAYVRLKKDYLKENQKNQNCLTPDQWYLYEATRAVNQAIGRVIRHKNDYGAIILCDSRFEGISIKRALSSWVQPHIKMYESFGPVIRDLKKFFIAAEQILPPPRVRGPNVEIKLPTAVGASFDVIPGRSSKPSKTQLPSKDIPLASDKILEEYMSNKSENCNKRGNSSLSGKKLDLFGALEKPTTVIDFNNVASASCSKSVFKWSNSEEPAVKTKKLKVAPPKVMPISQDIFSEESYSSAPNVLKPSTSKANVTICPKQAQFNGESSKTKTEDKQYSSTEYISQVQKSLDQLTLKRFKAMCFEYHKTKDYKKMLVVLEDIMLGGGRNFTNLFRNFRCFVKKPLREEFDEHCLKILPK